MMNGQLIRCLRQGIAARASLTGSLNRYVGTHGFTSSLLCNQSSRLPVVASVLCNNFHSSALLGAKRGLRPNEPEGWPKYNEIVYPPRPQGQPMRVAEVFHHRSNIKYSYKKMWYIASLIRGMSIDQAIKQLEFVKRIGSDMIIEVLKEAQELAVAEHNVEYRSNLWVAESFVGKAHVIKALRKHRGYRFGTIRYGYIHYFVCLREGTPPEQYYTSHEKTGHEHVKAYLEKMRDRKIRVTL